MIPMTPEEREFFETVYHEVYPKMYKYAVNQLSLRGFHPGTIPGLAEELIQDACHTTFDKKMAKFTASPNPSGFLMNVLKYKFQEFMRQIHSDNRHLLSMEELPWDLSTLDPGLHSLQSDMEHAESLQNLRKILSEEDLQLFTMVALNHASHKTAAEKFGITVWASQKRLNRIRTTLQKHFSS